MSANSPQQGEKLIFNGINGATGAYLLPPITPEDVSKIAKGDALEKNHLQDLKLRHQQSSKTTRGVKAGIDPQKISSAGWGVIFANQDDEKVSEVKEALGGLLELRQSQAGELYQEFNGEGGYQLGETYIDFLAKHNIGPGPADPERVPYYLLIVGNPEVIPFAFQYQLDVQYAVGRIYFDTLEQYEQYAQSVVEMESKHVSVSRQATFFGVQNLDDPATQLSATHLVQPLAEKFSREDLSEGWKIQSIIGEGATKKSMTEVLGGDSSPALFFSASHGMGFPKDDTRQLPHQGALLCQDWPGPKSWKEPIPEEYYFSADDISNEADFAGSIAFLFACYGAGTPQMDDFAHQAFLEPAAIAPHNFLARLPLGLLSHPNGGMQAVIGHVERAWGYSFTWEQSGSQLAVFESALKTIMDGYPVGYAMEYFNARYAELSTILSTELQGVQFGKLVDDVALAGKWTANNDARSYVVIGDPAVRIHSKSIETEIDPTVVKPVSIKGQDDEQKETTSHPQTDGSVESADWIKEGGYTFGQMQVGSQVENIKAAIAKCQADLVRIPAGERSENWQQNHIRLANLFKALYELADTPDYADQAKQSCSTVLEVLSLDEQLREWAAVNFCLAHLDQLKYEKGSGTEAAERALEGYEQILATITCQDDPFFWAQTHYYLANLQIELSSANMGLFQQSETIDHLNQALTVFTSEIFPFQFVEAKTKLGDLLISQIEEDQAESIELAIQAYESTFNELYKVAHLIPESSIYLRLGDAFVQRVKGDRTNNDFQALAYYKQCLASLKEVEDHAGIEELEQKIAQVQSRK